MKMDIPSLPESSDCLEHLLERVMHFVTANPLVLEHKAFRAHAVGQTQLKDVTRKDQAHVSNRCTR
jgi:hypothetical protein